MARRATLWAGTAALILACLAPLTWGDGDLQKVKQAILKALQE